MMQYRQETRAAHLPWGAPVAQPPMALPVYRSTTFEMSSVEEYDEICAGQRPGYVYSRDSNPTCDAFAAALGELEAVNVGAQVATDSYASGKAAVSCAVFSFVGAGERMVCSHVVYNGTSGFLGGVARRLGVETTYVDIRRLEDVATALKGGTSPARVLFVETIGNPTLPVADLRRLAELAHAGGALFIVDSTFATPAMCRPLEFGADIVIHSGTKAIGGHADCTGGAAVGRPELVATMRQTRMALGSSLAPDEAYLLHRGLATLPLRMARQCETALNIAQVLEQDGRVAWVSYPGLSSHPDHELAARQFDAGRFGTIVSFRPIGGEDGAVRLCDRLRLISRATSLGAVHSKAMRITPPVLLVGDESLGGALVRLSVGLEHPEDLLSDLDEALDAACGSQD